MHRHLDQGAAAEADEPEAVLDVAETHMPVGQAH